MLFQSRFLKCLVLGWCLVGTARGAEPEAPLPGDEASVAVAEPATSVLDRYRTSGELPDFPLTIWGPEGISGPPCGSYYAARSLNWVQADYLLWWLQGQAIGSLVTDPNGTVLGGDRLDDGARSGLRIRGGHFFDCDGACGIMADVWGLDSSDSQAEASGGAVNGFVLPYTDMDLTLASNQVNGCACLDTLEGTAASVPLDGLSLDSESSLWSGATYFRGRLNSYYRCGQSSCCCQGGVCRYGHRLDGIVGYRYLSLDETLRTSTSLLPVNGAVAGNDLFDTENDFHGLDLGFVYERECGRWALEALSRVAVGVNHQVLSIDGTGTRNGGIFAQSTNIGTYEHDALTVIPEVNLTLSYSLTCNLRARFGYSFLWLSNVIRPAKQIDTRLDGRVFDLNQSPPFNNPPIFFPQARFETESVWLQGLNCGLEYWF